MSDKYEALAEETIKKALRLQCKRETASVMSDPEFLAMARRQFTGIKPLECPFCELKFIEYGKLKDHIIKLHKGAGIPHETKAN